MTMGDQPLDWALQFQRDQKAGRLGPGARFLFAAGMAPPGGGPDSLLIKGTTPLKAVYEVTSGEEARSAVRTIAAKGVRQIKIWVDDRDSRRGGMQKMTPDVYKAIVDEAHTRRMLVHAHATSLADQKAVVKAGVDVLVHTVANEKLDEEMLGILREKRPYWAPVMGLTDRAEVCDEQDRFSAQVLPGQAVVDIREGRNAFNLPGCAAPPPPNAARREENLKYNVPRMVAAGARLLLSTDAGILPQYAFGSSEHHEIEMYVKLGISPSEAIVAATKRPTEVFGIDDAGTLAAGKRADFVVLAADPLDAIQNTRKIVYVYLNGVRLDRERLLAKWSGK